MENDRSILIPKARYSKLLPRLRSMSPLVWFNLSFMTSWIIWSYLLEYQVINFKAWFYYMWLLVCCLLTFAVLFPFKISMVDLASNIRVFTLSVLGNAQVFAFLLLVITISLCVFSWSRFYIHNKRLRWFFSTLFVFVSSMIILIFRDSLFSIFLGWEGLGVSSFLLIVFYQNWMRVNGGLLTLLTNRIGDACLALSFSYWIFLFSPAFNFNQVLTMLTFILAFTKRAQWPFTSWLPAAMAAPTPVSALVHRSTLVTAGIWVLIRFFSGSPSALWLLLGGLTTLTASFAALLETDIKKIVALSTLSQLGLMVVSLYLGGKLICFFHLICHALAKADLFLIVGRILGMNYSQQDSRKLPTFIDTLRIALIIRILRLRGVLFQSGMYSKEQILSSHFFLSNRILSWASILVVVTLTISYCLKLLSICLWRDGEKAISNARRIIIHLPILVLSTFTIVFGFFYSRNASVSAGAFRNYWITLLLFFIFSSTFIPTLYGFSLQLLTRKLVFILSLFKSNLILFLVLEPIYFVLLNICDTLVIKKTLNVLVPLIVISFMVLLF